MVTSGGVYTALSGKADKTITYNTVTSNGITFYIVETVFDITVWFAGTPSTTGTFLIKNYNSYSNLINLNIVCSCMSYDATSMRGTFVFNEKAVKHIVTTAAYQQGYLCIPKIS